MEFNWLGVAFVSEGLPNYKKIEEDVEKEMERLQDDAKEKFNTWLESQGLEQVMGVIVKKDAVRHTDIPIKAKLSDYTWTELQTLSKAHVDFAKYNIRVGDVKDNRILVDISDKAHYDGLVFMYNTGKTACMNDCTKENEFGHNHGGYANSEVVTTMEKLYDGLEDQELKSVIKEVTVKCNDGYDKQKNEIRKLKCHLFLPSVREIGFKTATYWYSDYEAYLTVEGSVFEYFSDKNSNPNASSAAYHRSNLASWWYWLRSACGSNINSFWCIDNDDGALRFENSYYKGCLVATFVI